MATPQVPPRPIRHQIQPSSNAATLEPPHVPQRPSHRRLDRSVSPHRDSFARSPLNESPFGAPNGSISTGMYSNGERNASGSNLSLPARPPSVNLPSIGQEGSEYAGPADNEPETESQEEGALSPTQTRNVGSDLPLHAPKPSLSTSSAKARIATVTRTDSSQAAAIGIGKAATPVQADDKDPYTRRLSTRESVSSIRSSVSTERPSSAVAEDEHGIPEIGQRVPMYPNAGDVQAPSQSPFSQTFQTGIGFHNDGTKPRHHGRKTSGRETFHGPPGSYGLHGHGIPTPDKFEKAWYDKHPEALVREEGGQYGPGIGGGRGEWALSSEDLNKIVRQTASRGSGFGTSANVVGLPNEQIGYMASEEYASRLNSPRPQSGPYHHKAHSHSQTHVESPLRKASFPVETSEKEAFDRAKDAHNGLTAGSEQALDSEMEDDDVIHIDAPETRRSKWTGNGYDPPKEDLGPRGGNTEAEGGYINETGYGVPILASDEVAKEPGMEHLQPAVSPVQERRGSTYYSGVDSEIPLQYQSGYRRGSRPGSATSSRPTSRPASIHGGLPALARFTSHDDREDLHTPLEDVDEYEPLFPDDEKQQVKPHNIAERFRNRPDAKRRFPSQDIWEDTPNSLQLQAEVTTPEPVVEKSQEESKPTSAVFETPETEAARKGEVDENGKADLLPKEERWAKSNFKPHIRDEMHRPGMKQRFPSRDIWEDSPDSVHLETTVGGPQGDELRSPPDEGLIAGAVVNTSGRPDEGRITGDQARDGATAGAASVEKPSIPPRPAKAKHAEEDLAHAGHAAPSIPARPQKTRQVLPTPLSLSQSVDGASPVEAKQVSPTESRKAPALPDRGKPQVPARPAKPVARDSSESIPLSKTTSATSLGSDSSTQDMASPPPVTKPKPLLPARPTGSKIAALKAGFMSDLDKRLQLGPQAPPKVQELAETEKEEEKAPLADARKGRAKGPARRKPAISPATMAEEPRSTKPKLAIAEPWTTWHIPSDGNLILKFVHAREASVAQESTTAETGPAAEVRTTEEPSHPQTGFSDSTEESSDHAEVHGEPTKPEMKSVEASHTASTSTGVGLDGAQDPEPTTHHVVAEPQPATHVSESTDTAVQTGEKSIIMDKNSDAPVKFVAYEGGMAQQDGDVLVREQAEAEGERHTGGGVEEA